MNGGQPPRTQPGDEYGLLTAVRSLGPRGGGNVHYWLCSCACGGSKEVNGQLLRRGATKSCGCLKKPRGRPPKTGAKGGLPWCPGKKTDGRMWVKTGASANP